MNLDEARAIGAKPYRKSTPVLEEAVDVLGKLGNDESDQYLIDDIDDELGRREDIEPPYDTPSLDLPTYGA